jgi:uncharacterized damage-inducible protein DinB
MNREDILDLYRYNAWASGRIFDAARSLPPEALNRDLGSNFRSIRDTLAHLVGSEWVWFARWTGPSPTSPPDWVASSGLEELAGKLGDLEARRWSFLSALDDAELERAWPFTLFQRPHGRGSPARPARPSGQSLDLSPRPGRDDAPSGGSDRAYDGLPRLPVVVGLRARGASPEI